MILKIVCVYLIIGAIFAFICSVRWNTESDGIFDIVVAIMSVRWHMSKKLCNVIIRACIFVRIGIRWLPSLIKATITVLKRRRKCSR